MSFIKLTWSQFAVGPKYGGSECYYSGSATAVKKLAWSSPVGWVFYEFQPEASRTVFEAWFEEYKPHLASEPATATFVTDIQF